MEKIKNKIYDLIVAIMAGCIMFLILATIDYFLQINADLLKKILSSLAAGVTYFIERIYHK